MSAAGHISFFSHALRILNDLRETCGEGDMLGSAEWVAQAHLFVSHRLIQLMVEHFATAFAPVYMCDMPRIHVTPCFAIYQHEKLAYLLRMFDYEIGQQYGNFLPEGGRDGRLPLDCLTGFVALTRRLGDGLTTYAWQVHTLYAPPTSDKTVVMLLRALQTVVLACGGVAGHLYSMAERDWERMAGGENGVDWNYVHITFQRLKGLTIARNKLLLILAAYLVRAQARASTVSVV